MHPVWAMRAAIYMRVSTDEQTTLNQRAELARLVGARGWGRDVKFYEDVGVSGSKMSRPGIDSLMEDARAGRVQVVAVWALDRLGRNMQGMVALVLELDRLGVQVVSVTESWLDTGGPVRTLLLSIFGWVAEQERSRLIERTRAGLARARAEGTPIGRPRKSPAKVAAALRALAEGTLRFGEVCREYGVSARTLNRYRNLGSGKTPLPRDAPETLSGDE